MGSFHVYVDGPKQSGPDAMRKLAEAMQLRYGLPASELISRMTKGRFRVKGNIDSATAAIYRRDLEAIGARVTIEETPNPRDAPGPVSRPSPPPARPTPNPTGRASGRSKAGSAPPGRGSAANIVEVNRSTQSPNMDVSRSPASATKAPIGSTPPGRTGMTPSAATPVVERIADPPPSASAPAGANAARANAARPAGSSLPPSAKQRPASAPILPPQPVRDAAPALPPSNAARPAGSSLPPSQYPRAATPVTSGLAAAYGDNAPAANLGALDNLSLASLDGHADYTPAPLFDAPAPEVELSASIGPRGSAAKPADAPVDLFAAAAPAPAPTKGGKPVDVPVDLFAPPDIQQQELQVELAADEIAHRNKRAATPPPVAPASPSSRAAAPTPGGVPVAPANASPSSPVLQRKQATMTPAFGSPPAIVMAETPRWRLAAGVAAAIVLGFLPAHIVASVREGSSDREIDAQVEAVQKQADTEQAWSSLDTMRAAQLERKRSDHRNIMLVSLLIWAAAGAGIGYVWFRRVPWNRLGLG